jgi:hypothetical protein
MARKFDLFYLSQECLADGSQTLLLPVCFASIGEKTYYLFGIANAISIPFVWALYPESNQRTLEEMNLLFAADTPWNWDAEATFARLKKEMPEIAHGGNGSAQSKDVYGDEEQKNAPTHKM